MSDRYDCRVPPIAQLSLTALGLLLFWLVVWRRLGWSVERVIARGTNLYDRGDFAGALTLYRKARRRAPRSALPWECEGLACVMLEQFDDAALALAQAMRLQPKPVRQAHAYLALALAKDGQADRAREALDETVAALDAARAGADATILADAARAAGGEDLVCEVMGGILARHGGAATARLARAHAEWARGRPVATRKDAAAARDASPSAARRLEALALLELGDTAAAKRVAKDAAESLPAALRARLAREPDAARAIAPHDLEETIQRAWAIAEGGDDPGAVRAIDEALALEGDATRERTLRCVRAAIAGDADAKVEPTTPREMLLVARAAERAGETDRASELRERAARADG